MSLSPVETVVNVPSRCQNSREQSCPQPGTLCFRQCVGQRRTVVRHVDHTVGQPLLGRFCQRKQPFFLRSWFWAPCLLSLCLCCSFQPGQPSKGRGHRAAACCPFCPSRPTLQPFCAPRISICVTRSESRRLKTACLGGCPKECGAFF